MLRICGYAIVSTDGMIADADGRMGRTLIVEADQVFYHRSLDAARLVVHGRNSAESDPGAARRRRLVVTTQVAALAPSPGNPRAALWNPLGMPFGAALEELGIGDGAVAVVGGTDVFELFLAIGYDDFFLSRSERGALPGGRPVFRGVPQRAPEDILRAAGMRLVRDERLAPDLTLSCWERAPAEPKERA